MVSSVSICFFRFAFFFFFQAEDGIRDKLVTGVQTCALPISDTSSVVSGTYRSTHDYLLEAIIEVPLDSADEALISLNQTFGDCISELPSPLSAKGIRKTCVMANDDVFSESEEPSSRVYLIGTGLRTDGTRLIGMVIKSR